MWGQPSWVPQSELTWVIFHTCNETWPNVNMQVIVSQVVTICIIDLSLIWHLLGVVINQCGGNTGDILLQILDNMGGGCSRDGLSLTIRDYLCGVWGLHVQSGGLGWALFELDDPYACSKIKLELRLKRWCIRGAAELRCRLWSVSSPHNTPILKNLPVGK